MDLDSVKLGDTHYSSRDYGHFSPRRVVKERILYFLAGQRIGRLGGICKREREICSVTLRFDQGVLAEKSGEVPKGGRGGPK